MISEKNCPPLLAHKYPYYTRREMAGKYLPNPYHPPLNKVQIQGRFGKKWAKIKEAKPARKFRKWPQFKNGTYRYVSGYK